MIHLFLYPIFLWAYYTWENDQVHLVFVKYFVCDKVEFRVLAISPDIDQKLFLNQFPEDCLNYSYWNGLVF